MTVSPLCQDAQFPTYGICRGSHALPQTAAGLAWVEGGPENSIHHWPTSSLVSMTVSQWKIWWIFKDVKDRNPLTFTAIIRPQGLGGSMFHCFPGSHRGTTKRVINTASVCLSFFFSASFTGLPPNKITISIHVTLLYTLLEHCVELNVQVQHIFLKGVWIMINA